MTQHTIACIDGSALSDTVADYAAWSAKRMNTPLVLLNVLDDVRQGDTSDFSGQIGMDERQRLLAEIIDLEERRAKLARQQGHMFLEAAQKHIANDFAEPLLRQRHGDLVDTLVELENETRLLVIGRQGKRGNGIGQHIGHQVERVIRALHRPTWVVTGEFREPQQIMIAYDHSATAKKAVDMVANSPLFRGIPVHVVMVAAETNDHQAQVDSAAAKLQEQGFAVTTAVLAGDVEDSLLSYANDHKMDAMVMGAYGHSRIREFFVGSHTNKLLSSTKIPLLLLR
ncbi:universal stress protein [Aliidiomarina haloalkalitolerans]|uniref:Universal stress protein UspA n=1 Tax=Aliidiomarina haloalkalitolerans TaxID=859059 RepID=A0A432VSD6_9GAMM|nr:universal stress protein [Aliidiomarina haloalkalitolerans]RUO19152.1 universal stress protein UspA [Aliidiomarina haloalkalitolerans]